MKLPAMLLQPIVENAIKFGLYDTVGQVEISISAKGIDKGLAISVTNPLTILQHNSYRHRLWFVVGSTTIVLTICKERPAANTSDNDYFVTTVTIPQIK
jgi:LytS/YehU family sensor histidine kinase